MDSLFFLVSKITWMLVQPLHLIITLLCAWLVFRAWRRPRLTRLSGFALLLCASAIFLTPLPEWSVRLLENRFPVPDADTPVAGIIVLGGATGSGRVAAARDQPVLNGNAERLTTAMALHRVNPNLPLVVSGFSGRLVPSGLNEAEITRLLFLQLGLSLDRVRFEDRSRNTAQNARFTAEMAGVGGEDPWLLITSASHMPRSVASFRAAGVSVLPYPVDFRTEPDNLIWPREPSSSLGYARIGAREWLGLLAYHVTGRSREFFPNP